MTQDIIRKEVLSTASNLHQSEGLGSSIYSLFWYNIFLVDYIELGDAKFIITKKKSINYQLPLKKTTKKIVFEDVLKLNDK